MSRNRIRTTNGVSSRWLWWLLTAFFVAVPMLLVLVGLGITTNKLAKDNKGLETALAKLKTRNANLELDLQKLSTPDALQRRMAYFNLAMRPQNELQVVDARRYGKSGEVLARGKDYSARPTGGSRP